VPGGCTAANGYPELVRCAAQAGIPGAGAGQFPWSSSDDSKYLPVDLRSSGTSYLASGSASPGTSYSLVDPLQTLFASTGGTYNNLAKLPSSGSTIVFTNRTQHTALMAAEGAQMLGYPAVGLRWGMPYWNAENPPDWPEKLVGPGNSYAYLNVPAGGGTDDAAPTISGPNVDATSTTATITWTTNEPATTKLEWSATKGGPYTVINDTVLHASHSVNLTGLSPSTKYYYKVTSYDGNANVASTSELEFTTEIPRNNDDYVYYFPWYDTTDGFLQGTWVNITNPGANPVTVTIRLGDTYKGDFTLAPGAVENKIYYNTMGGMVEVRCVHCQASGDHLTVAQRALYNGSFNETIAPEHTEAAGGTTELGTSYSFPWYDNYNPGFMGNWIMVGNADGTSSATVNVYVGDMSTPVRTITIPPYSVDPSPVQIFPRMAGGPVKVVSTGGQKIVVSQRVLYGNSCNETFGRKVL